MYTWTQAIPQSPKGKSKMITIRCEFTHNGKKFERTFRTNNSGEYLFTGVSENKQISCDSGFHDEKKMKKAIREHLRSQFGCDRGESKISRIKYL